MQRVIFFGPRPETTSPRMHRGLEPVSHTAHEHSVSKACDSRQRVTLRRNSEAATPPGMHRVRRAKDAGKAPSASPSRTSDSLSFNGRYAPFARANSGVTATTSLGCRFCILRHRRPLRQLWSVARKSSGSRVSAKAFRAECACSDRTNGAKGRVRTAVQGGGASVRWLAQEPEVPEGSRWVRTPITGGPRTLISSCLCPRSVGSKDGRHCRLSFPPCHVCMVGLSALPRGLQQALLPTDLGMEPTAHEALCPVPPHPDTWGRGWRQQNREFKGHPGFFSVRDQPELHVSKTEAKSNKSIGIFI